MQPNVLLFISHDVGNCVAPYGYPTFDTPNFNHLAETGVRFAHSYCSFPVCSPSRASIVTGRYPHQNGVNGLVGNNRGFQLFPNEVHAAQHFSEAGYESVLCGMVHETDDCTRLGFERFLAGPGSSFNDGGDLLEFGEEIAEWLKTRDQSRPFYLQIGCGDAHRPWTKRNGPDDALGVWQPSWLEETEEVRNEMSEFQGSVKRLDQGLGGILAALDQASVSENTILVVTTDHGADVPMAKSTLRDPGLETYLFMRHPAESWGENRVIDDMVSNVDILPTLMEACSIPQPDNLAGRSFLPALQGQPYQPRESVFAEKTFAACYDPRRCIRTQKWKYIKYFEQDTFCEIRAATYQRMHQTTMPWQRAPGTHEELYDLENDPGETKNLAGLPEYAEKQAELASRLASWMLRTNDPLLDGPMSSPAYEGHRTQLRNLASGDLYSEVDF